MSLIKTIKGWFTGPEPNIVVEKNPPRDPRVDQLEADLNQLSTQLEALHKAQPTRPSSYDGTR